jgi:segregation and condensation protein B
MARTPERGEPGERPPEEGELGSAYAELLSRAASEEASAVAEGGNAAPPPLERIVEALLFLGGPPLTPARADETVRGLSPAHFLEAVDSLNKVYRSQGRPYRIRPRGQGFELALLPRFQSMHERLYGSAREARLTPAALDVLALVAYRQPATKVEVDGLRGADCAAPLRLLVRLGLIAVQRGDAGIKEVAYGTTTRFLTLFGLRSLDDLPRTEDPQRM